MRKSGALAAALLLSACVGSSQVVPPAAPPAPPRRLPAAGLERVMGKSARELEALFGRPAQDLRGATARRLVFTGPACVLDAYLYAPAQGREPVVTWVDARLPGGDDFDRASCVAALSRAK